MKHRTRFIWLGIGIATYLILISLLFVAESHSPGSSIRSFGDAVWYSIVTLTTVGYGDMAPVTFFGRLIGVLFLILSTGILVTLIGTFFSYFASEALPMIILSRRRYRNWYYFADYGQESYVLAQNIVKNDLNAQIIFGEKRDEHSEAPDYPCLFVDASPTKIVALKKGKGKKCQVFLMKENDIDANIRSLDLERLPVEVYARSSGGLKGLMGHVRFFHSYDCTARQYWLSKPICNRERNIVLIGFGQYGHSILKRAILTNVLGKEHTVNYHVFGSGSEFVQTHRQLGKLFSIGEEQEGKDALIFYNDYWGAHPEVLEKADRIIICTDDEPKGWKIYRRLTSFYCVKTSVDIRTNREVPGVSCFGEYEQVYTPEHITCAEQNDYAVIINDLFRRATPGPTLSWDELDDFHRESKVAAADHLLLKVRMILEDEKIVTLSKEIIAEAYKIYRVKKSRPENAEKYREIDHRRWLRFYCYYNWTLGEIRDDKKHEHPMLLPYDELTDVQKRERDFAWELLRELSEFSY